MNQYLKETSLIDYSNNQIKKCLKEFGLPKENKEESAIIIYNYIRDSILFDIPVFICKASETLNRKCGQVITKNILLMAFCTDICTYQNKKSPDPNESEPFL